METSRDSQAVCPTISPSAESTTALPTRLMNTSSPAKRNSLGNRTAWLSPFLKSLATFMVLHSAVNQLVGRGPEVTDRGRDTEPVWATLNHEYAYEIFFGINPP